MKRKTRVSVLATAFVTGVTAFAFTGSVISSIVSAHQTKKTSTPVHLTLGMWSSSPAELALVKSQLAVFHKENPSISVGVRVINGNYLQALQPMLASHTAPDIFYVDSSVAPQLEAAGVLMNLGSYIKKDKVNVKDFNANLLQAFTWKKSLYGLPKDFNTLALEYNKTLFAKAGIHSAPATWPELQKDAALLKKKGIVPLDFPIDVARYYPLVLDFGGNYYNGARNHATFQNRANRPGLQYFMSMQENGVMVPPTGQGATWAGEAFAQGKVAMAAEGAWIIPFMQQTAPKVQYGISNFPGINGKDYNMIYTVSYSMAKTTQYPSQAAKLLFFMTGSKAEKLTALSGLAMPSRTSEQGVFLSKNPTYKAFVNGVKQAVPYQFGTLGQNFVDAINNATEAGILKNQTPQVVLSKAINTLTSQNQY